MDVFFRNASQDFKGIDTQDGKTKSCIQEGYITCKAMNFASQYCFGLESNWTSFWLDEDNNRMNDDEVPKVYTIEVMNPMFNK